MTNITIRNVPPEVRDELAGRAGRSGRSLQEYLRLLLIDAAARPSVEDAVADIRRTAREAGVRVPPESILQALHSDRR